MEIYYWKFWATGLKYLCQLTPAYWRDYLTQVQRYRIVQFAAKLTSITNSRRWAWKDCQKRSLLHALLLSSRKNIQKSQKNWCDMGCKPADCQWCWKYFCVCSNMLYLLTVASYKIADAFDMPLQFNPCACQTKVKQLCI